MKRSLFSVVMIGCMNIQVTLIFCNASFILLICNASFMLLIHVYFSMLIIHAFNSCDYLMLLIHATISCYKSFISKITIVTAIPTIAYALAFNKLFTLNNLQPWLTTM